MRMEAKNAYFKRIARRHQQLMCGYLQNKFFNFWDLECGPCNFYKLLIVDTIIIHVGKINSFNEDDAAIAILAALPDVQPSDVVSRQVHFI